MALSQDDTEGIYVEDRNKINFMDAALSAAAENSYPVHQQLFSDQLDGHTDLQGCIRTDLLASGLSHTQQMPVADDLIAAPTDTSIFSAAGASELSLWHSLGPAPLRNGDGLQEDSGEVVGIAIDPRRTEDLIIYLATGHGGVWKSVDAGTNWRALTDNMPSLSIGAVHLDRNDPDTVYAGTGNPFESNGGSSFRGVGLYKSTDGGESWTIKAASLFGPGGPYAGALIYGIETLPYRPGWLFVATNRGLFRSIDGGENFGSNSPEFNNGTPLLAGVVSCVIRDTVRTGTVYAVISGYGIFKSTDFGQNFSQNLFRNSDGTPRPGAPIAGTYGLLSFVQSRPPNAPTMYALYTQGDQGCLLKSIDRGATWTRLPAEGLAGGIQVGYTQTLGVDPQDSNRVFVGFVGLSASTDGGLTFSVSGDRFVHADHHAIAFSPDSHWQSQTGKSIYVGTDGGIYRMVASSGIWTSLNTTLATNIMTQIAMGEDDPNYTYGAIWDHGLGIHKRNDGAQSTGWVRGGFGDGGAVAVNPSNARMAYGTINGEFLATNDGGRSWRSVEGLPATPNRLFFVPFEMAGGSATAAALYAGISNGLFKVDPPMRLYDFPSAIHSAAASRHAPYAVWIGLYDGSVWRVDDIRRGINAVWTRLTHPGPRQVVSVAVHPRIPMMACIAYQGFSGSTADGPTQHVFLTVDGGIRWTDISGTIGYTQTNLPDLPVWAVTFVDEWRLPHPGRLPQILIANEVGVMISNGNTITSPGWYVFGHGLPRVQCNALKIRTERGRALIRVSTWGRGVFEWGDIVPAQRDWRWCRKCQGLFFHGNLSSGTCPAGGAHDGRASGDYSLMHNDSTDPGQHDWRWCRKCQGLFFIGNRSTGVCPTGGTHDHSGSGNYSLCDSVPTDPGQHGWRWCRRCQGLYFVGNQSLGVCPAGGGHDVAGSGDYSLFEL